MKIVLLFLSILTTCTAYSNVEINFRPDRPVMNEPFEMDVVVSFEGSGEPFISFDPGGLTVEGRRSAGVSFTTKLINGQFSSQKTATFVYQLRANRAGSFYLRDFVVKVDGNEHKKDNVRVLVLREAEKPKDFFIEVIPSKNQVYKGEGFYADYYLYTRVPVYGQELKEYPKLNGFLKRFRTVDETPERIQYNGLIYQRSKKYSARLFAEKIGKLSLDSLKMQLSVGYGGNTSFGLRDIRNTTISSSNVEIEVSEVPLTSDIQGYTGLVGEHTFELSIPKTKFLANEPIEFKLEVRGPGMLEKFDAPVFYGHPDLETFDTRSEVQDINSQTSRRVIEYTYLPRSGMKLEGKELPLTVFIPQTKSFKTITLKIPEIEVIGTASSSAQENRNTEERPTGVENKVVKIEKIKLTPVSPFQTIQKISQYLSLQKMLLLISIFIFILAIISNYKLKGDNVENRYWNNYKKFISKGVDYKNYIHFLSSVFPSYVNDVERIFENENINDDVRSYFTGLLSELRQATYSTHSSERRIKPNKSMFKKLYKAIR